MAIVDTEATSLDATQAAAEGPLTVHKQVKRRQQQDGQVPAPGEQQQEQTVQVSRPQQLPVQEQDETDQPAAAERAGSGFYLDRIAILPPGAPLPPPGQQHVHIQPSMPRFGLRPQVPVQRQPDLAAQITSRFGLGSPLPPETREHLEGGLGADLSGVRVHTDGDADRLARSVQAIAFTTGSDIFFRRGAYHPQTPQGLQLLAHEATHTIQQAQGSVDGTPAPGGVSISDPDDRFERAATAAASQVAVPASVQRVPAGEGSGAPPRTSRPRGRMTLQRRNGAAPTHFQVASVTDVDNANCSFIVHTSWQSSDGVLGNLDDVIHREHIVFNHDPTTDMPSYAGWAAMNAGRVSLVGTVLKKLAGAMQSGRGSDKHDGVGLGPSFTIGGIPNLVPGVWTLTGTQTYEYIPPGQDRSVDANWQSLHPGHAFTITRDMRVNPVTGGYELVYSKTGPGMPPTSVTTPIAFETDEAMTQVGQDRGDQTADWTADNLHFANAGLNMHQIAQDVRQINGSQVTITYQRTDTAAPGGPGSVSNADALTILPALQQGMTTVLTRAAGTAVLPAHIFIILSNNANVRQQAYLTRNLGNIEFRIVVKPGKFAPDPMNPSIIERWGQRGVKQATKRKNKIKSIIIHEMGHLLHGFTSENKYLSATTLAPEYGPDDIMPNRAVNNPVDAARWHVKDINLEVKKAIGRKIRNGVYKTKWGYAKDNPAEVVAEVFLALLSGKDTVKKGLAAVYVAYGGKRSPFIDQKLRRIFGGTIPTLTKAEDCIPYINADT